MEDSQLIQPLAVPAVLVLDANSSLNDMQQL